MDHHSAVGTRVRLRLKGRDAALGRVPAADVARLLDGLQSALARASGLLTRKEIKRTGRWAALIEDAVKLRLVSVTSGSVVTELELPEFLAEAPTLPLDAQGLGEMALERTLDLIAKPTIRDAAVAHAVHEWAHQLGIGTRYDALEVERIKGHERRKETIDAARADKLRSAAESAIRLRKDAVVGTLVEADFENHTARLRAVDGAAIVVEFDDQLADDIQRILRHNAQVVGQVHYDPKNQRALRVQVQEVLTPDQLGFEPHAFWGVESVDELQREQNVAPITDIRDLQDANASKAEIDAILSALAD
jgi:hypothetical protein